LASGLAAVAVVVIFVVVAFLCLRWRQSLILRTLPLSGRQGACGEDEIANGGLSTQGAGSKSCFPTENVRRP
jgi:hypothetical protein